MKTGARPFHVAIQDGALYMWAAVNDLADDENIEFQIRGTGHPLNGKEGGYIGTAHDPRGYVWHVFHTVWGVKEQDNG
jgi:hypothetical protein